MLAVLLFILAAKAPLAQAQTYTVTATTSATSTTDANPGDGTCATADGVCTLRAAIEEANATTGKQTVNFNIPSGDSGCASGVCELYDGTILPVITDPIKLNGPSQPGSVCGFFEQTYTLSIIGNGGGSQLGSGLNFRLGSGGSEIFGLVIGGFNTGLSLIDSNDNFIFCNLFGTDGNGLGQSNSRGMLVGGDAGSSNNLMQANTFAGNAQDGLVIINGNAGAGSSTGNNFSQYNRFFSNGDLGVDLGDDGVDANDAGDPDVGPNRKLNRPVISNVSVVNTRLTFDVVVDVDPANAAYNLQIDTYRADASGEGELWLRPFNRFGYGTGAYGNCGSPPCTVTRSQLTDNIRPGDRLVVLVRDDDGNTSEFSDAILIGGATVNSTADAGDADVGDGRCQTASGVCTLRAAIEEANHRDNNDEIGFNIPGTDAGCSGNICSIQPGAQLDITSRILIDGSKQPGNEGVCTSTIPNRPTYRIVLDGTNTGASIEGLRFLSGAGDSVVRGLAINNFQDEGIEVSSADRVQVACSFIGTTPDGLSAAPNDNDGVVVLGDANNTIIGTNSDGVNDAFEGNLISSNAGRGVRVLSATGTVVAGNYIGTNKNGQPTLGNTNSGVQAALNTSQRMRVGSDGDGTNDVNEGNVLAGNANDGVTIVGGQEHRISRNSIFGNTDLGIDLGSGTDTGVTLNDAGDGDGGANKLQNTPVPSAATWDGTDLNVTYLVDSTPGNSAYSIRVEVFTASSDNQGQTYLGTLIYRNTDARTSVTGTFTPEAAVNFGDQLVATAIDGNGNTSEFSPSVTVFSANESFVVTTLTDEDDGTSDPSVGAGTSLREAIAYANRIAGTNTITFDGNLSGTMQLTGALPAIASNMTIQGPGANVVTVRRNTGGNYTLLTVNAGATATISGLTFTNGNVEPGGLLNNGTLTLQACAFHENGDNNSASGNRTPRGGGIQNNETLTVEQCTFSANRAFGAGGAISNFKNLTVTNSTFSNNRLLSRTPTGGSAISNSSTSVTTITNSTFAGNESRGSKGAVFNDRGSVTIGNSIFKKGLTGQNISVVSGSTVTSSGYNLCDDTCGGFFTATGDQISTDPLIGNLQDNGGPTQTHAPLENSPAVDAGNCAAASTDQRGEARPVSLNNAAYPDATNGCDIGAVEVQSIAALPVELTVFEAALDNGEVFLEWTTASETNNAGFAVEHQAPEQTAWAEVAFVGGAGTTTVEQVYQHRFTSDVPGVHRFRLKQVDFDGTFAYSPEVEATLEMAETFVLSAVYPNPFNPSAQFSVRVREAQQVSVAVYDALGRQMANVFSGPLSATTAHVFTLDGSQWASGLYVVRVRGEQFVRSQTVSLIK
ncbi:MAG: hypothetical protein RhofKO_11200 [Rhodothermales bacterium]